MSGEHSDVGGDSRRQPVVIVSLGIEKEPFEEESPIREVLGEESEPSHEEIQKSLSDLLKRPYEFQEFDEAHLTLARALSITPDETPFATLIYEIFDNLCNFYDQRVHDADNHIYSAPFIIQQKDDPEASYLLGIEHRYQYNREGKAGDLERSISCMRKAVDLAEGTNPELPKYLFGLANSLLEMFERFAGTESLEEAIYHQRRAITLFPPPKPKDLADFGHSLLRSFQVFGHLADLEEAIEFQEQSVDLITEDTESAESCFANLAGSLLVRFENSSDLLDLDRAIEIYEKALQNDLEIDTRATIANNIGSALQLRCLHLVDVDAIDRAIAYQEKAVDLTSDQNVEKPRRLTNLGNSLQIKFENLGNMDTIQVAIKHQLHALDLLPKKHILRAGILNDLGKSYLLRFNSSGEQSDIEQCLVYLMEAVKLTPMGSPEWPKWLFNLGHALREKFESQGTLADIDHAITVYFEAVAATPKTHIDRAERLDHLGSAYMSRFERLGELIDLDNAINQYRAALSIYGDDNPKAQGSLNNLGIALGQRFERLDRYHDIDESIAVFREAIRLSSKQSNTPTLLNSLGVSLWIRYKRTEELDDINESISSLEDAISLTPEGHRNTPIWLHSLALSLRLRCNHTGRVDDLHKAIGHQKKAVHLIPEYHSDRPALLRALGDSLEQWHLVTVGDGEPNWADVIEVYRQAALSDVGKPVDRFEAAYSWAEMMSRQGESPLEAYRRAFSIVPQVVWMGTTIDQRYNDVPRMSRLTTRAVSQAIAEGEYSLALEWFEEGRSIVWGQMLALRTPLEELRVADRSLAEKLERVARALEQAGSSKPTHSITQVAAKSLEQAAQSHHRLAEDWDRLLGEVRQIDGFSDFLRPKKSSTLMKAARNGPIVAINVDEARCDALIIMPRGTQPDCVSLARLSLQKATDARRQLMRSLSLAGVRDRTDTSRRPVLKNRTPPKDELKEVVEFLWADIVRPVLEHLQYLDPHPDGELPHITWCVSGPLVFLPLHTAGHYADPGLKPRIFNYVVSSYTPTIHGLLVPSSSPDNFSGILTIGQASTPGLSDLPGTREELASIERHLESLPVTRLVDDLATPEAVLDGLNSHSWVHFACHASQVPQEPTSSAFYLHTETLDLKTITKRALGSKAFAFLSACQTASGDVALLEEAVHLAAGMIMAGYPTVIATMWSIRDSDAPLIAEHTYAQMLADGKPDSTKAARALHRAVGILRDNIGENALVAWVPYIHIGV